MLNVAYIKHLNITFDLVNSHELLFEECWWNILLIEFFWSRWKRLSVEPGNWLNRKLVVGDLKANCDWELCTMVLSFCDSLAILLTDDDVYLCIPDEIRKKTAFLITVCLFKMLVVICIPLHFTIHIDDKAQFLEQWSNTSHWWHWVRPFDLL